MSVGLAREVRLYNKGTQVYDEEIDGERYKIAVGDFVVLPRRTAVKVRGHYIGNEKKCNLQMSEVTGSDKRAETTFVCNRCGEVLPTADALKAHVCADLKKEAPAQKSFACHRCGKEFPVKADLLSHLTNCKGK